MEFEGSRWYKFDFHTHTPASDDYGKGPNQAVLRQRTPREWLLDFMAAEIDCVAVTDHNSGEWIDVLKNELEQLRRDSPTGFKDLTIFPGCEISTNNGIHVLAIFDPSASSADIAGLLGAVKYRGRYGSCTLSATDSAEDIARTICELGGLAVLAHADCVKGAFELPGATLQPLLESKKVSAIEIVDPNSARPEIYKQRMPAFAEVTGSDSHHPSGPPNSCYPGSRFTYIKMGAPNLDGLRLALLDGNQFSIKRSDEVGDSYNPNSPPSGWIRSISVSSAKLMGRASTQRISFSPWLTALVGGRGTGKSSVAHFMRGAFQRSDEFETLPKNYPPRQTYDEFVRVPLGKYEQGALTAETKVEVEVWHEGSLFRIDWHPSKGGHSVYEFEEGAGWKSASSQEVRRRFQIAIFSQNQVNALASSESDALLKLIDESIGGERIADDIERARLELFSLFSRKREFSGHLRKADAVRAEIEDLNKKISRLDDSSNAASLAEYRFRLQQVTAVDRFKSRLTKQLQVLKEAQDELGLDEDLLEAFPATDSVASGFLAGARALVDPAKITLKSALESAEVDIIGALKYVDESKEAMALAAAVDRARMSYDALAAELGHDSIEGPDAYSNLVLRRSQAEDELSRYGHAVLQVKKLDSEIEVAENSLRSARRRLSYQRLKFLTKALRESRFVRIQLRPYGKSVVAIEESVRDLLGVSDERFKSDIYDEKSPAGGIVNRIASATEAPSLSRLEELEGRQDSVETAVMAVKSDLIEAATTDASVFGGHFTNYLRREFERKPEFVDRIASWFPADSVDIAYSPQGDGKTFKPIGQASSGQKAAAMLAFLLAHGSEPILIDQPEDDLDNSLIYDLLVQQIRNRKGRRQVIAITHNPNIVVNGDAELINVFEFVGGQCRANLSGCLQQSDVREAICSIMEGGRAAFERRYQRLV